MAASIECYQFQSSGKCTRESCPYSHHTNMNSFRSKNPNIPIPTSNQYQHYPSSNKWERRTSIGAASATKVHQEKICRYWKHGKCSYGEKCKFLHQWFKSDSFAMVTQLRGHDKAITGIALQPGTGKLLSGGQDESVKIWDCNTGACATVCNVGGQVGCMMHEGPWVFIGIPNAIKGWNTQTNTEVHLSGPCGQVYALVQGNGMLFAGYQNDGNILAWRFIPGAASDCCFEPTACLQGHSRGVISLAVGGNRLYSGSMDNSIKVWDLQTLQCVQTLTEHTNAVMSVLCWDQYLLSCSLDQTVKVWRITASGFLEVLYNHREEGGVLALRSIGDAQEKPVLVCSCNDNTLHFYDLPTFGKRGKIFSKEEMRAIEVGPGGLFFTGDGAGELKVWKWSGIAPA